jgi:hypothetical protein
MTNKNTHFRTRLFASLFAVLMVTSVFGPIGVASAQTVSFTQTVQGGDTTVAPGGTFTVDATVDYADVNAPGIDVTLPADWTITSQSPDGGTYSAPDTSWVWFEGDADGVSGSHTVTYTVAVPGDAAAGNYVVGGEGSGIDPADSSRVATTDDLTITVEDPTPAVGSALVEILPDADSLDASTFGTGSFQVTNTGEKDITSVSFDLSTATLPDMVFDPDGTAGDPTGEGLNIVSDGGTGITTAGGGSDEAFSQPHNGVDGSDGYDVMTVEFGDFQPGETATFWADNDPTSIKGATVGSQEAGPVSGLELARSTVTVTYADGTSQTTQLMGDGSNGGSTAVVTDAEAPAPTIGAQGVTLDANVLDAYHSGATVSEASQTITVSGQPGETVTLVRVEGELSLSNVPDSDGSGEPGYDIEELEANNAVAVEYYSVTLDSNGDATIPVTLTSSADDSDEAGFNYFVAAEGVASGDMGLASNVVVLKYETAPVNTAPTVDAITDQGVSQGDSATVDVSASDAEGDSLTLAVSGPAWVSLSDAGDGTGTLTLAPGTGVAVGTYTVEVTADDGQATSAIEELAVYVDEPSVDGTVVVAVNVGGPEFTAGDGTVYEADSANAYFSGGSTFTTGGAGTPSDPDIANTDDDTLYQSERFGDFTYAVPVENGDYEVTLQFAEIFQGVSTNDNPGGADGTDENDRLFDVAIEGQTVVTSYDIFSEVGPLAASDKHYTITVTDGELNLAFTTVNDNAKLSAVRVESLNTPPVANAGTDQTVDEQSTVTLDGTGSSDADGDTLSYAWTQTAGPTVTLSDPTAAQPTFTAPDVSAATVLTFELTVDDGTDTDSDLVDVTVQPVVPETFEIVSLSAPSTATQGDLIDVSADVTNTGDETATKTLEFRIDTDGDTLISDETALTTQDVEIAAGATETVTFSGIDTSGLAPGTYTHGVVTPDDSATAIITIEAPPTPATFEVSNLQAPSGVTAGDLIDVSADVTNTGEETATQTVEFRLDLDQSGTLDADEVLTSTSLELVGGASQTVSFTDLDTTGLSGEYLHGIFTDDDSATATITVSETVPATFEVSNLQAPATVTQGDVIDVSADVTNTGDESATKTVEFRIDLDDDSSIDDETAFLSEDVTLAPGETQTVTFTGIDTASLVADTYVHGVVTPDDVATATLTVEEPATERTIRIVGEGPRIGYEVVVDDTFTGGTGLQSSDSISADGTTATGFVSTGSDEYTFVGSVTSIQLDGPAMVYIDGVLVDPADFGDERVITIVGEGPRIGYEVVVDDTITGGEGLQSSDSISADGTTATGFVSTGSDEYTFVGNVESILLDGPAMVYIDGELVDPADFGDERVITIVGEGPRIGYEFVVDDTITGSEGLQSSDSISADGTTATGFVSTGSDEYTFVGNVVSLQLDGPAMVYIDGELVDPADFGQENLITIVGDGTRSSYEFVVGGEVTGGNGLQSSDEFDGRFATGFVTGGSDEYTYTGDLQAIDVAPGVTVLVNGVAVDPNTFADVHQISFVGDGDRSDYEFIIDGEVVGGDGLAGSDSFTDAGGSGSVWGATDTYYYVGALEPVSVTVDGGATVLVDGTEYTGTTASASLAAPTGELVTVFG